MKDDNMLSLHYRDNPVKIVQKYKEECSNEELREKTKILHEEIIKWYIDNEEQLNNADKEETKNMGKALNNAREQINKGRIDEAAEQYKKFLEAHEKIINQNIDHKKMKRKIDRHYTSWKDSEIKNKFIISEEFMHEIKRLDEEELEHASKGIEEIQKYHELIHKITTGVHNHHDVPKSLKYYPKSRLWGVRCGNKHELIIFSYAPSTNIYKICDYIDYHTHDEASAHRGRYYEIYAIGSRTEKTYNFRDKIMLTKKLTVNNSQFSVHSNQFAVNSKQLIVNYKQLLFPLELNRLTQEELEIIGINEE